MKHLNQKTTINKRWLLQPNENQGNSKSDSFTSNLFFKQFSLCLLLLLCILTTSSAQEIWRGNIDSDWSNNNNWVDNTAPLSGAIGGVLTFQAGAPNQPTTNIPTTITATQLIIMSPFTIPDTVTVNVDNSTGDGVVTSLTGAHLTVLGTLNVSNAAQNGLEIGQDGTQLLNCGTITVTRSGLAGMLLTGSGSSVNTGTFSINHSTADGIQLLNNAVPQNFLNNRNSITILNSGGDAIDNATTVENSNNITIDTVGANGILNSGTFTNDSLATLTINKTVGDGISTSNSFINDAGIITIGNGNIADIGGEGINVTAGGLTNNSTVSQGGGTVTINGVTGDGIMIANLASLQNGATALGDTLGKITIDNTNGNGLNLTGGAIVNQEHSEILVGNITGGIRLFGLAGLGSITNANSIIRLSGTSGASSFTSSTPLVNSGDCSMLEITGPSTFSGGLTNNAVIISSAPANSVSGSITNNGLIIDPNNSFGSTLTAGSRASAGNVTNTNGVIVAPYNAMCFTDTIEQFLITGLANPITTPYLPSTTFTMGTNNNAATLDTMNNRLILNTIQSLMDFTFDINFHGASCNRSGSVSLAFDNLPDTYLACVGNLQVTLINGCQAILKPENLLRTNINCSNGYKIGIMGGTMGDSLILDASHIGQQVQVMVTNPLGNSCWTTLSIEDKTGPVCQQMRDTTFFCGLAFDPTTINTYPLVTDACGTIKDTIYRDSIITLPSCGGNPADVDTLRHIIRTWTFFDNSGNSSSCTQNLYELKPTLQMVQFPSNLTDTTALSCEDGDHRGRTGYPFVVFAGDTILVNQVCKFGIDTLDLTIQLNCPGKQRTTRTWRVTDWCAPLNTNPIRTHEQLIDVVDTIAPTFTLNNTAIVTGNADHGCSADLTLPAVTNIQDGCSSASDISVTIIGPSNTIFANGGVMPNVPFGTHDVIYIVADGCGNERTDTLSVTVNDILPPVAIGREVAVTLVDSTVVTWVYANTFDAGSHDNCSVDSFLVRKSYVDTFATQVGFTCFDEGVDTIMIRVVDTAGNASVSWALARVEDKLNFCPDDNDLVSTRAEDLNNDGDPTNDDSDGDLIPNYLDADDDNDGVPTASENPDPNGDGIYTDAQDTDNDGTPDYLDTDDDGDNIPTLFEANPTILLPAMLADYDSDGKPDYLDNDDDNDGRPTITENPDMDGNPATYDPRDLDTDTYPDYLDRFDTDITQQATIAGHIQNENGEMVESVNITIGGYDMAPEVTGANGTFMFEEIPLEGNYMITPEKDMNYGNGVSTYDIVLLSKHILGLKKLDSPYKMIAADINHSGTISAYDMVLLRQVILGTKNDFPNNTSWRFIDANYEFLNPEVPFDENYPEAYEIKELAADMMTLDFIAVKIGDLNNSAFANQFMQGESRTTSQSLNFQIEEQTKEEGELVTVEFKSSNFQSILGYQFTLDFDGNALAFEQILMGKNAGFENFNLSMIQRGMITTSWSQPEAVDLAADEVIFSLVFKAKQNLKVSEMIKIGSAITPAEAYTGNEAIVNVNLEVNSAVANAEGFKLYQNKPNPFTGETIIGFDLPKASPTTLTIFDMSGKIVKVMDQSFEKGYNQILLDAKAFNQHGMFYYQLATNNGMETKKMILLKQ